MESFTVGDTIEVVSRIKDKERERLSRFQGVVIAQKGKGVSRTFTVRRVGRGGVGVERIYPLHSPKIEKIEVIKRGNPKRSKLYYLRERKGKAATHVRTRSKAQGASGSTGGKSS